MTSVVELLSASRREHDPPESWETIAVLGGDDPGAHSVTVLPYFPGRWCDVPPGAAEALESTCGAWRLDQLFVVPATTRRLVWDPEPCVSTPMQVVGLAEERVALWVDAEPRARVVATLTLDELAAVDHAQIGAYVRLTLVAPDRRLTVRYDPVARHEFETVLSGLRAVAGGCPLPVPATPPPDLPHEWAHLVHSSAITPRAGTLRLGELESHAGRPRAALVALTPYELVVAREPDPDLLGRFTPSGHDVLAIPRRQLIRAEIAAPGVRILAGHVEIDLALPQPLAAHVVDLVRRDHAGPTALSSGT
jgi:hypothetical protein